MADWKYYWNLWNAPTRQEEMLAKERAEPNNVIASGEAVQTTIAHLMNLGLDSYYVDGTPKLLPFTFINNYQFIGMAGTEGLFLQNGTLYGCHYMHMAYKFNIDAAALGGAKAVWLVDVSKATMDMCMKVTAGALGLGAVYVVYKVGPIIFEMLKFVNENKADIMVLGGELKAFFEHIKFLKTNYPQVADFLLLMFKERGLKDMKGVDIQANIGAGLIFNIIGDLLLGKKTAGVNIAKKSISGITMASFISLRTVLKELCTFNNAKTLARGLSKANDFVSGAEKEEYNKTLQKLYDSGKLKNKDCQERLMAICKCIDKFMEIMAKIGEIKRDLKD